MGLGSLGKDQPNQQVARGRNLRTLRPREAKIAASFELTSSASGQFSLAQHPAHRLTRFCQYQVVGTSLVLYSRAMALLASTAGVFLLLLLAYTLHSLVCLLRNYLAARNLGVPVRIIPVDHINPLWILASQKVVSLLRRLPFGLGDNNITEYNYLGFEIPLRWKSHEEMGDAFVLCSPARNWLYLGNPDIITGVLKRNNDFPHDSELTAMLDVFGPNISTVSESPAR